MATFVPFAILRMIPAVEAGAVGHLEGLRERGTAAVTRPARTAASHALHEGLGALGRRAAAGPDGGGGSRRRDGGAGVAGAGAWRRCCGEPVRPRAQKEPAAARGIGRAPWPTGDPGVPAGVRRRGRPGDRRPGPKGPKPMFGPDRERRGREPGRTADAAAAAPCRRSASGCGERRRRTDPLRARTGPATPEDAWKWEGVPPGRRLIGKVEPGEMRYYMDDDGHGPQIRWLPAAWPPGQGPPGQGPPGPGTRTVVSAERGSRYRFGPRERGGGLAGWRAGQIVTVAVGLVFGVLVLRWEPNAVGVAAAIGVLVLYGALATVPVAGRTGDEWLPVVVCWGTRRAGVGCRAPRCTARAAPAARRLAGHGRGARPRRADAHGGPARCAAAASPCWERTSRIAGSARGPPCCPRWPARARRCTGCSGWRRPSPTTAKGCGRTSPPRRRRTRHRPAPPPTTRC